MTDTAVVRDRYEVRIGKWGAFFYDTLADHDMPLGEVCDILNGIAPPAPDDLSAKLVALATRFVDADVSVYREGCSGDWRASVAWDDECLTSMDAFGPTPDAAVVALEAQLEADDEHDD